jgi:hypothetical protein
MISEKGEPFLADVGVNAERRRANEDSPMFVQEIGDLAVFKGLEEFDVKDYYLVPKADFLHIGSTAEFSFYKKSNVKDLKKLPEADAIFLQGKWKKPLPKK